MPDFMYRVNGGAWTILEGETIPKNLSETLGSDTVEVRPIGAAVTAAAVAAPTIGGVTVGDAGATGTLYEGYTLRGGDDFTALNIVGPNKPTGYLTTRAPIDMPGTRASAASAHYYTDPLHTGHNDANRGVPVGYDNMSIVGGSRLKLQSRIATTPEKATFSNSSYAGGKPVVLASSINTTRQLMFYVGPTGGEILIESMIRHTAKAGNPAGWHPTFWTLSGTPTIAYESDEIDVIEGNSQSGYLNRNTWVSGVVTNTHSLGPVDKFDGTDHLWTARLSQTEVRRYVDGVNDYTISANANSKSRPQYLIWTSVVYNAAFEGETFNESAWIADADGAAMEIDYYRIWSKTALPHYKPLATVSAVNVGYAGTQSIVLPSKLDLWGDAGVTEDVSGIAAESNDPTNNVQFVGLPPGVTYNSGTRTISVDWSASSTPPGRLHLNVVAWNTNGSTTEPLNIVVNRGPRVTLTTQSWPVNVPLSLDLYPFMDCGNLLPKTGSVTGLPTGLSFDPVTFLVTGTPTAIGSGTINVTTTNSVGQTVTAAVDYTVATDAWATSGALVDLDYENNRAYVNGTYYADLAAARTAGVVVQTGGIDRVPVSGFITSAYTLAGKGTTSATSIIGQSARYLVCLDDGADGAPADELVALSQNDNAGVSSLGVLIIKAGVDQASGTNVYSPVGAGVNNRSAFSVAANDLAISHQGGAVILDTSSAMPVVTQMVVGNRDDGTRPWLGTVKRVVLLNTAVSDAALVSVLA